MYNLKYVICAKMDFIMIKANAENVKDLIVKLAVLMIPINVKVVLKQGFLSMVDVLTAQIIV